MLGRVMRLFTENWGLKLAAVALAILLWLAIRADAPRRATFNEVPVRVDLRDPNWRLLGDPIPATVSISITGPMAELTKVAAEGPRVILPVDRVSDSIEAQVVPAHWIQLPPSVDRTRVNIAALRPDTIQLRYERLATRTLPVRVTTQGNLPAGLALALPINTNPSVVEVRGPRTTLARLDSVPLNPVDLSGLRSTTNVPTTVDSAALEGFRVNPREVNVILRVVPVDSQPGLRETEIARRRLPSRRP